MLENCSLVSVIQHLSQCCDEPLPVAGEEFIGRTQGEEGLLQISLHLLPDALLHVVGAVALIPVED